MQQAQAGHDRARIMRFLAKGPADLVPAAGKRAVLLDGGERGTISASVETIRRLSLDGLVRRENGKVVCAAGEKAQPPREPAEAGESRVLEVVPVAVDGVSRPTVVNAAESPLGLLARRRGKDGVPFLDATEFAAGERLRRDYTRGQIMPRMGANWVASVASGRRDGGAGGLADLTDAALAARQRVEKALDAVGPELAGVLVDICCFLKGLETVEMERGWPVRSAKVVLKTGLIALARHYDPPRQQAGKARQFLHWGAEDFRPALR